MNVVFLDIQLDDLTVSLPTEDPYTCSYLLGQFACQYSEAIFRDSDNVVLTVPDGMC